MSFPLTFHKVMEHHLNKPSSKVKSTQETSITILSASAHRMFSIIAIGKNSRVHSPPTYIRIQVNSILAQKPSPPVIEMRNKHFHVFANPHAGFMTQVEYQRDKDPWLSFQTKDIKAELPADQNRVYKFRIRYCLPFQCGVSSSSIIMQALPPTPSTVLNVQSFQTSSSIRLSWSKVPHASSYVIRVRYYGQDIQVVRTSRTALLVSGLLPDSEYFVSVTAVNSFSSGSKTGELFGNSISYFIHVVYDIYVM